MPVLISSAILFSSPSGFCDSHFGDVYSCVVVICGWGQLVASTTRTAAEIQNASSVRISLNVLIGAIALRAVEVIPSTSGKFEDPKICLERRSTVLLTP